MESETQTEQKAERDRLRDHILKGGIGGKSFETITGENYKIKNVFAEEEYPYEVFVEVIQQGGRPTRFRLGSILDHLEVKPWRKL